MAEGGRHDLSTKFKMSIGKTRAAKRTIQKSNTFSANDYNDVDDESDAKIEYIDSLNDGAAHGKRLKLDNVLVIPVASNAWSDSNNLPSNEIPHRPMSESNTSNKDQCLERKFHENMSLDEIAKAEIIRDAESFSSNGKKPTALHINQAPNSNRKIEPQNTASVESRKLGILEAAMIPGINSISGDVAKLKYDLNVRANDINSTSDVYRNVPISEYGAALLRGMGWTGPNPEDDNKYKEQVEARHHKLGLGATPRPPEEKPIGKSNIRKPGDRGISEQKKQLTSHWAEKAEKARNDGSSFDVGHRVIVSSTGQCATIVQTQGVPGLGKILVQVDGSKEKIPVGKTDLKMVELGKYDTATINQSNVAIADKLIIDNKYNNVDKKHQDEVKFPEDKKEGWLALSIRVRLVGRCFKQDKKLYCKKGTIISLRQNKRMANIKMDSGVVLENVIQDDLETVLPACGEKVLILQGKMAGKCGKLLRKGKEKSEGPISIPEGTALVKLDDMKDNDDVIMVDFDHVAAYAP